MICRESFACFWAGDSRAYRIRDGEIAQLTRDHSLVQGLVDAGMLDPAEAEDHPNANVVTRAVGASETLEVDTSSGDAHAGDTFLLASDGLTRVVTDDEISFRAYVRADRGSGGQPAPDGPVARRSGQCLLDPRSAKLRLRPTREQT